MANDNPPIGSQRQAMKYAATGTTTSGNLVESSDWPLVKTFKEVNAAPGAPAANTCVLYAEDNGSGKTRLMVRFPTGSAVQVAIEP